MIEKKVCKKQDRNFQNVKAIGFQKKTIVEKKSVIACFICVVSLFVGFYIKQ